MEIEYRLPYVIHINADKYHPTRRRKEMWKWCKDTLGDDKKVWSWDGIEYSLDTFYFNDMQHANWFLLKWL